MSVRESPWPGGVSFRKEINPGHTHCEPTRYKNVTYIGQLEETRDRHLLGRWW